MTRKYRVLAIIPLVCAILSGCSSRQLYGTGQEYQRNQCLHLPDKIEIDRCLAKIDTSYDEYKREQDTQ